MRILDVLPSRKSGIFLSVVSGLIAMGAMPQAIAQDEEVVDEVVVTGSYIKRRIQSDSSSPISILGSEHFGEIGAKSVPDIVNSLTVNSGAQIHTNSFVQERSAGSTNINLRGLGVSSTLVLLNGNRTTLGPDVDQDGHQSVNLSALVPMIAVDRVEILKDGASSLYGSDAVAGVVNFITRDSFDGLEFTGTFSENVYDSQLIDFGVIFGAGSERGHVMAAVNYMTIDGVPNGHPLVRENYASHHTSNTGYANPSNIINFFGPPSPARINMYDPQCGAISADRPEGLVYIRGICRMNYGYYGDLIVEEERLQIYSSGSYNMTDNFEVFGEVGIANNEVIYGTVPTQPAINTVYVPENHPDIQIFNATAFFPGDPTPFTTAGVPLTALVGPNYEVQPIVKWWGRPLGAGTDTPTSKTTRPVDQWRTRLGVRGDINENWDYEVGYSWSSSQSADSRQSIVKHEFQEALYGRGGPNNDEWYYFAMDSQDLNSQEVMDQVLGVYSFETEATQKVIDARVTTNNLFDMGGGSAGAAFGVQFRKDTLAYDYNNQAEKLQFIFFIGGDDFLIESETEAAFVELALPFTEDITVNLSARYEDLGTDDTVDPKVALLWQPTENWSLRASWGTAFRTPPVFGSEGAKVYAAGAGFGSAFLSITEHNPNTPLVPQESTTINVGATFTSDNGITASVDYFNFDYDNFIAGEASTAVLGSCLDVIAAWEVANPGMTPDRNALCPQVEWNADVVISVTRYISNAKFLTTDGIDLSFSWAIDTDSVGTFTPFFESTYLLSYEVGDPTLGTTIDGLGVRNFGNIGSSNTELKANAGLRWHMGNHAANIFVRYTDDYLSDQAFVDNGGSLSDPADFLPIDSMTTVDIQYSLQLPNIFGAAEGSGALTIGARNVTDETASLVGSAGGFDERMHDPRGREVYLGVTLGF
jgi:iron complex outermembrane receptor protein